MSVPYTGGGGGGGGERVQYNGGCSVHQGDIMSRLGNMSVTGGYHAKFGEDHWESN